MATIVAGRGGRPCWQASVIMEQWSGVHRGYAVKAYYQHGESLVQAQRAFRRHFNVPRNRPVPSNHALILGSKFGANWGHNKEKRRK